VSRYLIGRSRGENTSRKRQYSRDRHAADPDIRLAPFGKTPVPVSTSAAQFLASSSSIAAWSARVPLLACPKVKIEATSSYHQSSFGNRDHPQTCVLDLHCWTSQEWHRAKCAGGWNGLNFPLEKWPAVGQTESGGFDRGPESSMVEQKSTLYARAARGRSWSPGEPARMGEACWNS